MKKEIILIFVFVLILFSVRVYGLTPNCGNNTIFTLYSTDNSHVAAYNGAAASGTNIAICYNDSLWGWGDNSNNINPWECNGENNLVMKLSSLINGHAGSQSLGYTQNICYDDLKCEVKNSCVGNEKAIASLSSQTNAHVSSNPGFYPYKLCCAKITTTSIDASWIDPLTGEIKTNSTLDSLINITVNILNPTTGNLNIIIYNKSNNFELARFENLIINNGKVEMTLNISLDILKGNAGIDSIIYMNATYNSLSDGAELLIIKEPKSLKSAKWIFGGSASYSQITQTNRTQEIQIYVESAGISNDENITIKIYDESGNYINETNIRVNNNIALSSPQRISYFIDSPKDKEKYYFNASYNGGNEMKSNFIEYNSTGKITLTFYSCFNDKLTQEECRIGRTEISSIKHNCESSTIYSSCFWRDNKCHQAQAFDNDMNEPVVICEAQSNNQYSECIDGWKTLSVTVNTLENCPDGSDPGCSESGSYKVPCRAVAVLPIFSLMNIILAAGLILIIYFVIFRTKLFNSSKK